jgi:predicted enzyme related to lactoylglutathione lyase
VSAVTSRIAQWTLDVQDVGRMAEFWSEVLGYEIDRQPDGTTHLVPPAGGEPTVWLQPSAGPKQGKNRDHLDLRTPDQAAEVERVVKLGATRVDVGQTGEEPFVVLADPEGNEFCILR